MKKKIWIYGLVSAGMFSLLAGGCSKIGTNNNNTTSQLPNVTTNAIANVTQTTATCGGNVIFGGPDSVIAGRLLLILQFHFHIVPTAGEMELSQAI